MRVLTKCVVVLCAALAVYEFDLGEQDVIFSQFSRTNSAEKRVESKSLWLKWNSTMAVLGVLRNIMTYKRGDSMKGNFNDSEIHDPDQHHTEYDNFFSHDRTVGFSPHTLEEPEELILGSIFKTITNILIDGFGDSAGDMEAGVSANIDITATRDNNSGCNSLCASNSIPVIPDDNSHYVEGESRYIWMPDGEGVPHLVDLHQTPEDIVLDMTKHGADNTYWLHTRDNPDSAQEIIHGDPDSIWKTNYDASKPIKVVIHGWISHRKDNVSLTLTKAFLEAGDSNVIVLDWSKQASRLYSTASNRVPSVGHYLGQFLDWLINNGGGDWSKVNIVGFSIGAHIAGCAGRSVGGLPGRITGLDPAGPFWFNNPEKMRPTDGQYVEAIHTDGGRLGIFQPVGGANIYVNGGRNRQPGCWLSTCSHKRVVDLYLSSIYTNHFVAHRCNDISEAQNIRCSGDTIRMGNNEVNKEGSGIYGLRTGQSWPY